MISILTPFNIEKYLAYLCQYRHTACYGKVGTTFIYRPKLRYCLSWVILCH